MNKKITLLCAAMYAGAIICSQKDFENGLNRAEQSCHVFSYKAFLKKENFSQERINYSLFKVIKGCSALGNVAELIQHNLAQGGQTTVTKRDIFGSHYTPLEYLVEEVKKKESEDLAVAIQLLVNNGDPSLDKSLVRAAWRIDTAAVKMLLNAGADPSSPVYWAGQKTNAIKQSEETLKTEHRDKKRYGKKYASERLRKAEIVCELLKARAKTVQTKD